MPAPYDPRQIPLPKGWTAHVRSAVLHIISLARFTLTAARGCAANKATRLERLADRCARQNQEIALLREELRLKDARMERVPPRRRPYYRPTERMAILELRAARGWSLHDAANAFMVTEETIASWLGRSDEDSPNALVQLTEPVNKFPQFVRYIVQRLTTLCPAMGKLKIAQVLCRAGLHLSATTVGRMLKEPPARKIAIQVIRQPSTHIVTAKRPNHVWHVDLTVIATSAGFWAPWLPFALPQCWPFCWWVAVVIDHFSRRTMAVTCFTNAPTAGQMRCFLRSTVKRVKAKPKYIICDKGKQFWCNTFKQWCRRQQIRPRFGAVDQHGSIAVIERFIKTMKVQCTRLILVPLYRRPLGRELRAFVHWYNEHRPHTSLAGSTPDEAYYKRRPANRLPRFEPRPQWPRPAPWAAPRTLIKGKPGVELELEVTYHDGRKHLPVVTLRRAA